VISWNDFVLDDFLGPSLIVGQVDIRVCRRAEPKSVGGNNVREDFRSEIQIQETEQRHVPARMVGQSGSEKHPSGMEADSTAMDLWLGERQRGEA